MFKRSLSLLIIIMCASLFSMAAAAQDDEDEITLTAWESDTRLTILVMGMDRRPELGDTLQVRTDAILLVSIDPTTDSIGIMHIPRDVHFSPPQSDDLLRVNTLMLEGELIEENYGPYYMMDTLQYNLGMYIDRYVLVDFDAFITLVDAIGGIEITTDYTIDDPTYPDMDYGYDPFYLPAGDHLLDGEDALRFARTRHGDNDFLRGVRQIEVVTAIYEKLRDISTLTRLAVQAPDLLDQLERNVYTDLTMDEALQLATYGTSLSMDDIQTGSMNEEYIITVAQPGGTNVFIPDRTQIAELLASIYGENYAQ